MPHSTRIRLARILHVCTAQNTHVQCTNRRVCTWWSLIWCCLLQWPDCRHATCLQAPRGSAQLAWGWRNGVRVEQEGVNETLRSIEQFIDSTHPLPALSILLCTSRISLHTHPTSSQFNHVGVYNIVVLVNIYIIYINLTACNVSIFSK